VKTLEEKTRNTEATKISWPLVGPVVAICVATLLGYVLTALPAPYTSSDYTNVALIYLVATVFSAVSWGLKQSLVTAIVGLALYHFWFRVPDFALEMLPHELISLLVFVSASMITALIGSRARDRLERARERERTIRAFSRLYEDLMLCETEQNVIDTLGQQLSAITGSRVYLFLPDDDETMCVVYPYGDCSDDYIKEAKRVFSTGIPTPPDRSKTLPFFYAMTLSSNKEAPAQGVLGIEINRWTSDTSNTAFIHSLADQAAFALDRARLAQTLQKERSQKEKESLRSALLASVTHDLKTPLSAVIGSLSSLRHMHALDDEARKKLVIMAHDEACRLNDFISNILHMTRLESGTIKLDKDWHNPATIVRRVARRLENRLQGPRLEVFAPSPPVQIHLDAMLIEQVLQNLLDNAVKYGKAESTISVHISMSDEGDGMLSVSNEGASIPTSKRKKLFDKFYRASKRDSAVAGTGLGLAICQAIMDIHGGTITVDDARPDAANSGVTFTLTFPDARPD
jgi:two-component system sensor histidine kinase KdpD